jgi:hypothetical protein
MIKRMITATSAILLGVLGAAQANARPQDTPRHTSTYESWSTGRFVDDDEDEDRPVRRRQRRRTVHHAPRHAAPRDRGRTDLRSRALTRQASGVGTSRGCLRPAAQALLERIEAKFERVQVVSTCRPGAIIAGSGRPSKHASGEAIDFNAPGGRKAEVVRWLIANHKRGGTMTYAGMSHIHVDIGYHFVALNSRSGS